MPDARRPILQFVHCCTFHVNNTNLLYSQSREKANRVHHTMYDGDDWASDSDESDEDDDLTPAQAKKSVLFINTNVQLIIQQEAGAHACSPRKVDAAVVFKDLSRT